MLLFRGLSLLCTFYVCISDEYTEIWVLKVREMPILHSVNAFREHNPSHPALVISAQTGPSYRLEATVSRVVTASFYVAHSFGIFAPANILMS